LSTHTYRLFIFLKNRCFHPAAKRCAFYRIKTLCQALRAKNSKPTRQNRCTIRKNITSELNLSTTPRHLKQRAAAREAAL